MCKYCDAGTMLRKQQCGASGRTECCDGTVDNMEEKGDSYYSG